MASISVDKNRNYKSKKTKPNKLHFFLLGNSPASEFYMPTFRNTVSVPFSWAVQAGRITGMRLLGYIYGKRFGLKIA